MASFNALQNVLIAFPKAIRQKEGVMSESYALPCGGKVAVLTSDGRSYSAIYYDSKGEGAARFTKAADLRDWLNKAYG